MKILILGAGQVGTSLAKFLSRDKANDLTIVDRDAALPITVLISSFL